MPPTATPTCTVINVGCCVDMSVVLYTNLAWGQKQQSLRFQVFCQHLVHAGEMSLLSAFALSRMSMYFVKLWSAICRAQASQATDTLCDQCMDSSWELKEHRTCRKRTWGKKRGRGAGIESVWDFDQMVTAAPITSYIRMNESTNERMDGWMDG